MDSPAERLHKHTDEAERLLDSIDIWDATDSAHQKITAQITAEAQVHAVLALAAAVEMVPGGIN